MPPLRSHLAHLALIQPDQPVATVVDEGGDARVVKVVQQLRLQDHFYGQDDRDIYIRRVWFTYTEHMYFTSLNEANFPLDFKFAILNTFFRTMNLIKKC